MTSSAPLLRPEIVITPNPARVADLGVTTTDIAEAARIATSGDFLQRLAKLNLPERQVPIRAGFAEYTLEQPALIGQLRVRGTKWAGAAGRGCRHHSKQRPVADFALPAPA